MATHAISSAQKLSAHIAESSVSRPLAGDRDRSRLEPGGTILSRGSTSGACPAAIVAGTSRLGPSGPFPLRRCRGWKFWPSPCSTLSWSDGTSMETSSKVSLSRGAVSSDIVQGRLTGCSNSWYSRSRSDANLNCSIEALIKRLLRTNHAVLLGRTRPSSSRLVSSARMRAGPV